MDVLCTLLLLIGFIFVVAFIWNKMEEEKGRRSIFDIIAKKGICMKKKRDWKDKERTAWCVAQTGAILEVLKNLYPGLNISVEMQSHDNKEVKFRVILGEQPKQHK